MTVNEDIFRETVDMDSLWCPVEECSHDKWVTNLVCTILKTFPQENCFISQLVPVCGAKVSMAVDLPVCYKSVCNVVLVINPLHTTYQLDWFRELVWNHHSRRDWLSVTYCIISVSGWHQMCHVDVQRKEQAFVWDILLLFHCNLRKALYIFLCNSIFHQAALAFEAGSSVAGTGSYRFIPTNTYAIHYHRYCNLGFLQGCIYKEFLATPTTKYIAEEIWHFSFWFADL